MLILSLAAARRVVIVAAGLAALAGCDSTPPSAAAPGAPAPVATQAQPRIGRLLSLDALTGKERWQATLPMDSVSPPLVSDGRVFVTGSKDCDDKHLTVVALDEQTGRTLWQVAVPASGPCAYQSVALHVSGGLVIAGGITSSDLSSKTGCSKSGHGKRLVALDPATGQERWQGPPLAGLVLASTADVVITRGTGPQCLVGLDGATGKLRWSGAAGIIGEEVLVGSGGAVAATPVPGEPVMLQQLDPETGRVGWTKQVSHGAEEASVVVGDVVTVADEVEDPSLLPHAPSPGAPSAFPVTSQGPLDVSTLTSFDPVSGRQLWQQATHADGAALTAVNGALLATQGLGELRVRALDPRTGVQRWQSNPVRAQGFQAGVDGTVGVFFTGASAVGLRLSDGRTLWSTPSPLYYTGVVAHGAAYLIQFATPKNQPRGGN
jgi:outer membrane protein assembly factor BamB